jgi:hypothetical protein
MVPCTSRVQISSPAFFVPVQDEIIPLLSAALRHCCLLYPIIVFMKADG